MPWFGILSDYPILFGVALYAFDGVRILLSVENHMQCPEDMLGLTGVLTKSMVIVAFLFSTFGGLGFLKYGDDIHGTITHNMPIGEFKGQLILGSYALAIFFSYALRFYVPMEIIRNNFLEARWSGKMLQAIDFVTITTINLFIFGLATAFPNLELFVSLLGAITMTTLNLMAPSLIDTASNWNDLGKYKWKALKNGIIFVLGVIVMLMGTFASLKKMVENIREE